MAIVRRADGSVDFEDQPLGVLQNFYCEAVGAGATAAADYFRKLIAAQEDPELYRHSRRRK
jgi:hypothetical protein